MKVRLIAACVLMAVTQILAAATAFGGFNGSAPNKARRIFTQLAFAQGRLVSYHVLEPGPQTIQAFPTDFHTGVIYRFPGCPQLRPVLDDTAVPSASTLALVGDEAMRDVYNVTLKSCATQPTSTAQADNLASSATKLGTINAAGVPAPAGAPVPSEQQQPADELWGPVPNTGTVDTFAGGGLSPQHVQGKTESGLPVANVQQPDVRRPRVKGYAAGQVVYFVTYESRDLVKAGLVPRSTEDQWAASGFPGERDLFFLAYGRAPLPPNVAMPTGSLDSNGVANDNQAVVNVVGGAPFWNVGNYSPLWKMHCLDGGITPTIGPGAPCGNTRFYQVGQPRSVSDVKALPLPLVGGIFRDINCPVLATDVNDDGVFADTFLSKEIVRFANVDWDGDGLPEDGVTDVPDSTMN